jgi:hypothetical protein
MRAASEIKESTDLHLKEVEEERKNQERRDRPPKVHFEREMPSNLNPPRPPINALGNSNVHKNNNIKTSKPFEATQNPQNKPTIQSVDKQTALGGTGS